MSINITFSYKSCFLKRTSLCDNYPYLQYTLYRFDSAQNHLDNRTVLVQILDHSLLRLQSAFQFHWGLVHVFIAERQADWTNGIDICIDTKKKAKL